MIKQPGSADVYTDFNGLAKLRGQAKDKSPQAIREASRQFESVFIQMALKSMRSATQQSKLMNDSQSRTYRDMYDQQLAIELGKRSRLGLASMLERQLGGKPSDPSDGTAAGKSLQDYRQSAFPVMPSGPAETLESEQRAATDMIKRLAAPQAFTSSGTRGNSPFDGPEDFVKTLWPHAKAAADELGVDPKMLLAQSALESGWGKSVMTTADGRSSHNLFGIKADRSWAGNSIAAKTLEYEGGVPVRKNAAFRAYDSYADCFRDYVGFLKANPRYAKALENVDRPERFIAGLQRAGYATDPHYARKVLSIYKKASAFEGLNVG